MMGFYLPDKNLYTSFIAKILNLVIYTALLFLAELGNLGKIIHFIQINVFDLNNNYHFHKNEHLKNLIIVILILFCCSMISNLKKKDLFLFQII